MSMYRNMGAGSPPAVQNGYSCSSLGCGQSRGCGTRRFSRLLVCSPHIPRAIPTRTACLGAAFRGLRLCNEEVSSSLYRNRPSLLGRSDFGGLSPLKLYELDAGICVHRRRLYRSRLRSQRLHRIWRPLMSPPRDTAGSAAPQQTQQPADAGRYNQKSTTFRNGTTEEGWFYPTPAALKAAADVRGTRAARESCCLRSIRRPRAQATRKPITRTSSSIRITRTAWCTASEARPSRSLLRWA